MGPRVSKHESWTKYYFLNIKIISIIFTPLMRITCKRKSYIWTKSNKETWGDLILFAELSKFSSLRNHAGQKWCICCCLLCLENHASGSGFSKKVFLIQSNGCKRGKKKRFRISVKEAQDEKQAQEQTSTKETKAYNQTQVIKTLHILLLTNQVRGRVRSPKGEKHCLFK